MGKHLETSNSVDETNVFYRKITRKSESILGLSIRNIYSYTYPLFFHGNMDAYGIAVYLMLACLNTGK